MPRVGEGRKTEMPSHSDYPEGPDCGSLLTPTSVCCASATDQLTCQSQRHGKVDHTVSTPWGDGWGESVLYKIINRRLREGVASDTQGESHAQCSQPQRRSGTASRRGSTGSHPWGRRCHQAGEARAECWSRRRQEQEQGQKIRLEKKAGDRALRP